MSIHRSWTFQLARKKAEELEDFNHEKAEPELPADVVEEGTKIVEEMLRAWASSGPGHDGEDVVMGDEEEATPEEQLEELRRCVEQFRPRIEGNAWAQSLIASL